MKRVIRLLGILLSALTLGGCEEERTIPTIDNTTERPVETMTISDRSTTASRRFGGVVAAAQSARISFEVGGRIAAIPVNEGDDVAEGALLARLDPDSYRTALEQAEARLEQSLSRRGDARDSFERRRELVESDNVSQRQLERAREAYRQARADVRAARAQVALARQDLDRTRLEAPFAGTVARRMRESHEQISPGQTVITLDSPDAIEISVSLPEDVINQVHRGDRVRIDFPTTDAPTTAGRVTEIAGEPTAGAVFPVTVMPEELPEGVQPGMTAEVVFTFDIAGAPALLVPLSALASHPKGEPYAHVFRFDPTSKTVHQTTVRTHGSVSNRVAVVEGLKSGDTIVTAGVHELRDGQTVKQTEQ